MVPAGTVWPIVRYLRSPPLPERTTGSRPLRDREAQGAGNSPKAILQRGRRPNVLGAPFMDTKLRVLQHVETAAVLRRMNVQAVPGLFEPPKHRQGAARAAALPVDARHEWSFAKTA